MALYRELERNVSSGGVTDILRSERRRFTDPFFFQDEQNSFLVEPTLTETTIIQWNDWVIRLLRDNIIVSPQILEDLPIEVNMPVGIPLPPKPDPKARFKVKDTNDWVTDPSTVLVFDDHFMGKEGGLDLKVSPATKGDIRGTDFTVMGSPSSKLLSGRIDSIVADASVKFKLNPDGPSPARGEPLNIISSNTMNPALLRGLGSRERRGLAIKGSGNI